MPERRRSVFWETKKKGKKEGKGRVKKKEAEETRKEANKKADNNKRVTKTTQSNSDECALLVALQAHAQASNEQPAQPWAFVSAACLRKNLFFFFSLFYVSFNRQRH